MLKLASAMLSLLFSSEIKLFVSISCRSDGSEEHREHLLYECSPAGPLQLVRPIDIKPVDSDSADVIQVFLWKTPDGA